MELFLKKWNGIWERERENGMELFGGKRGNGMELFGGGKGKLNDLGGKWRNGMKVF